MDGVNQDEMYSPAYPHMTIGDARMLDELTMKNGWTVSTFRLLQLIDGHEKARNRNDERKMEMIEYELTQINYHSECRLLSEGNYDECKRKALEW